MPISFTCPNCGHSTQVADQFAGQTGPCAKCGQPVTIPGVMYGATGASAGDIPSKKSFPMWLLVGCGCLVAMVPLLGVMLGLMLPAINVARERARQGVCLSNMRQTSLAMTNYESGSKQQTYPPSASKAANGVESISWRTEMLPHLDQQSLYDKYDKSQPWDGPKNQRFHDTHIEIFLCPSDPPDPTQLAETKHFVVTGPKCIFNGPTSLAQKDISAGDGESNTLMIVESTRDPVLWLEPRDLTFDDTVKTIGTEQSAMSSRHPKGMNVIFADGHGTILSHKIDPKVLEALLTVNGQEIVDTSSMQLVN